MKKYLISSLVFFLCSCSHISMPADTYVIDLPDAYTNQYESKLHVGSGPVFALMHINIPSYLNRPQIVLREEDSKIYIDERHRWGENLDKAIIRVLSNALTNNLTSINGVAVPLKLGIHPDYTIQLDISRFEGTLNKYLELNAFWTLQKGGSKIIQAGFYKKIPVKNDYSGFVQGYGELLSLLAKDMVNAFITHIQ